jgi:hypothetical protein
MGLTYRRYGGLFARLQHQAVALLGYSKAAAVFNRGYRVTT